jgi:protein TonB
VGHPTAVAEPVVARPASSRSPILFHSLVLSQPESRAGRVTATAITSLALHTALAFALVVLPLLSYNSIPSEAEGLRAFFVQPLEVVPPPPPPPPPAAGARPIVRAAPKVDISPTHGLVAPMDVPAEIRPEESLALGIEGGVPGGVEGGVPGGVVGGVVGGLPQEAPPPPIAFRVGGEIKEPKKLKDVTPVYPQLATLARVQGVVILECTISPRGRVTDVRVLQSIPLLDQAAVDAVKQWIYTPTLLNGAPVPVIMTVTVSFTLH